MLLLPKQPPDRNLADYLDDCIRAQFLPDYVYSYPPRQAFRPLASHALVPTIARSVEQDAQHFNLYLHFPFCRQLCGFCNLFATADSSAELLSRYVDALLRELSHYVSLLPRVRCRTVYFGGGTPSLLPLPLVERVLKGIERQIPGSWTDTEELCMEVAPDTLTPVTASAYTALGFTRVSMGAQTFDARELNVVGRDHGPDLTQRAIETALRAGITDVCVDLINGLPLQTRATWERSVRAVIGLAPPTVCTYNLTVRQNTRFSRSQQPVPDSAERYARYSLAQDLLIEAGYSQETNVRYALNGVGGYRQKVYHWRGAPVLGLGAGARTYLPLLHYQNGYSARHRLPVLNAYFENILASGDCRTDGIVVSDDERRRQQLILNLHDLGPEEIEWACSADQRFVALFDYLFARQLACRTQTGGLGLTRRGFMLRDLLVGVFFSEAVRSLVETHDYDK